MASSKPHPLSPSFNKAAGPAKLTPTFNAAAAKPVVAKGPANPALNHNPPSAPGLGTSNRPKSAAPAKAGPKGPASPGSALTAFSRPG